MIIICYDIKTELSYNIINNEMVYISYSYRLPWNVALVEPWTALVCLNVLFLEEVYSNFCYLDTMNKFTQIRYLIYIYICTPLVRLKKLKESIKKTNTHFGCRTGSYKTSTECHLSVIIAS